MMQTFSVIISDLLETKLINKLSKEKKKKFIEFRLAKRWITQNKKLFIWWGVLLIGFVILNEARKPKAAQNFTNAIMWLVNLLKLLIP